jgi:hypothetical protein
VGAEQQLVEAGAVDAGGWIRRRLAAEAGGRGWRDGEEKSQLKGISETRIEPGGWSENQWFASFPQNQPVHPVFTGLLAWAVLCA